MSIISQIIKKVISEMNTKTILIISAIVVLVGGGCAFALYRYFKTHPFRPSQKIQEMSTVINGVVSKKDLVTACYYEDLVVCGKKSDLKDNPDRDKKGNPKKANKTDEIVVIQGAIVKAGIKVDSLTKDSFRLEKDSVLFITIPEPVILGITEDINAFEDFSRRGKWDIKQVQELVRKRSASLEKDAVESGLLDRAYDNAMNLFAKFFEPFPYRIEFTPRSVPAPEAAPEVIPEDAPVPAPAQ